MIAADLSPFIRLVDFRLGRVRARVVEPPMVLMLQLYGEIFITGLMPPIEAAGECRRTSLRAVLLGHTSTGGVEPTPSEFPIWLADLPDSRWQNTALPGVYRTDGLFVAGHGGNIGYGLEPLPAPFIPTGYISQEVGFAGPLFTEWGAGRSAIGFGPLIYGRAVFSRGHLGGPITPEAPYFQNAEVVFDPWDWMATRLPELGQTLALELEGWDGSSRTWTEIWRSKPALEMDVAAMVDSGQIDNQGFLLGSQLQVLGRTVRSELPQVIDTFPAG